MPHALRIEYPGAIYHVMNRGDRREPSFRDDRDHHRFTDTQAEALHLGTWTRVANRLQQTKDKSQTENQNEFNLV